MLRRTETEEVAPPLRGTAAQCLFASGLLIVVLGFYAVAAVRYPMLYIWGTYEDLFGEWIQFWSLVVTLVISARLVAVRWRFRWFFLLLALSCFYVAMEEISWGQRILGFSSPDYFRANNLQGETNLHNFFAGPFATPLKAAITYVLAVALFVYGLVFPGALRLRIRAAEWMSSRGLAAPPLYLWPYFAVAAILEWGPFRFNEAEVAEVLVGLALAIMAVHCWSHIRHSPADRATRSADRTTPRGLTLRTAMVTAMVLLLSVGTTAIVYASPSGKRKIDARIENGIEKFAGRYARHKQWETAADLYLHVLTVDPKRASILRKLAECSREIGDAEQFDDYTQQALAVDLRRYRKHRKRESVNRSLARTYRLVADHANAERHLEEALRAGLKRIKKRPESASARYSLGKTYSLMGEHGKALEQLSRAVVLNPTSKKYRKAYYAARRNIL